MSEPLPNLERLREVLSPQWTPSHTELVLLQLQRRGRRRALGRKAAMGGAALALVGLIVWPGWRRGDEARSPLATSSSVEPAKANSHPPPPPPALAEAVAPAAAPSHVLHFQDGSSAVLVGSRSDLAILSQTPRELRSEVRAGRVEFDVTRNAKRRFQVRLAEVTVSVLGTRFTVERRGGQAGVWVQEGRVLVEWAGGSQLLIADEGGWFPRPSPSRAPAASPARDTWKSHAERGDYAQAFALMREVPPEQLTDRVDELLLAADAARLSGHPRESLPFLRQVLRDHRSDARASLAAFTLGRVLLTQLQEFEGAALAFSQVRTLAPDGSLAEDALAREVEARWKLGDRQTALRQAEEYLRQYPAGTRRDWIHRLGEAPKE